MPGVVRQPAHDRKVELQPRSAPSGTRRATYSKKLRELVDVLASRRRRCTNRRGDSRRASPAAIVQHAWRPAPRRDRRRQASPRDRARLPLELVDRRRSTAVNALVRDAERTEIRLQQAAVADTHARRRCDVSPQRAHDVDRARDQLRVRGDVRLADDVDVQLEVLAQTSLLLSLVAKELRHREPAHRLAQRVRPRATMRANVGVISGRSATSRPPLSVKL